YRERRAGHELEHAGQLPASEQGAGEVAPASEERQPVAGVDRDAMRRVEARPALGELLVRPVLVRVTGPDEGRLGRRVDRLAVGVRDLELQPRRESLLPFEL